MLLSGVQLDDAREGTRGDELADSVDIGGRGSIVVQGRDPRAHERVEVECACAGTARHELQRLCRTESLDRKHELEA